MKKQKLSLILLILHFSFSISWASNNCIVNSENILKAHEFEQFYSGIVKTLKLKKFVNNKTGEEVPAPIYIKPNDQMLTILSAEDDFLGYITYHKKGNSIEDILIVIEDEYKGQSLSYLLFASMFEDNPLVTKTEAIFIEDNLDAFMEAMKETNDFKKSLEATPYFKVHKRLGFTQIDMEKSYFKEEETYTEIQVVIKRPK